MGSLIGLGIARLRLVPRPPKTRTFHEQGRTLTLREFAAVRADPVVAALALDHWATQLAGRALFLTIGNGDSRVSSAACVRFALRLLELEETMGITHSAIQLHVVDSPGHSLSDHWRAAGADFLLGLNLKSEA